MKKWIFYIAVISVYSTSQAQSFEEWMKIIQKTGTSSSQIHLKMTLQVYDTLEFEELIHTSKMVMNVNGDKFHYTMDEMELIKNGSHLVVVDHSLKSISYSEVETDEKKLAQFYQMPDMDSILSFYHQPRVLNEDHNNVKFRVHQKEGYTNTVDLTINKNKKYLDELCYDYDEGEMVTRGYVRLKYDVLDLTPEFSSSEFDKRKFVEINNGIVKVSKAYQNYRLTTVEN